MLIDRGIDEFSNRWRNTFKKIEKCELTEEESQMFRIDFKLAELNLKMSRPYGWYTWEVKGRLQQLESELNAALAIAESNYRRGYGKTKAETRKSMIEAIALLVKELLKKIPSLPPH